MISLKTIAAACNVSVATVSKALNDHKDISEETRSRIKKAAVELGYTPNLAARSLKTNRTYNLGILFSDDADSGLTHDYFASVLDSARKTAEQRGYDITFINTCRARANRRSYLESCRQRKFDGVLIVCMDYDLEVEKLMRSELPVVMIDHTYNGRCSVVSDNIKGMHDLVHFVYGMGHRRIAYIHGETDNGVTTNRLSSFYRTCKELGVEVPEEYIGTAPYRNTRMAYDETVRMLGLANRPTCILYPDDFSCFGGINAIMAQNLKVGEDISVAGYDGIKIGRQFSPRLTTLEQDTARIGGEAANKLIELIESPRTTVVEMIVVEGRVFEGETVADIRKL